MSSPAPAAGRFASPHRTISRTTYMRRPAAGQRSRCSCFWMSRWGGLLRTPVTRVLGSGGGGRGAPPAKLGCRLLGDDHRDGARAGHDLGGRAGLLGDGRPAARLAACRADGHGRDQLVVAWLMGKGLEDRAEVLRADLASARVGIEQAERVLGEG